MREKNLDLLRILLSFMVVTVHVSGVYIAANINNPNLYFTIGNFYDSLSRVSVPTFVMLSGAFLLDNPQNKNYIFFYKKTFRNIILPTLIWSIIYFLCLSMITISKSILINTPLDFLPHIKSFLLGKPYYHMWYMYMIIGIYLITPALINLKNEFGDNNTIKLGILFLILGFIVNIVIDDLFWMINFIIYIGYFLLGYIIKKYATKNNIKALKSFIIWFLSSLIIFGLTEIIIRNNFLDNRFFYFYEFLSPFVIIGSLGLFTFFTNMKTINLDLNKIAKHTFNIYIIHAGLVTLITIIIDITKFNPLWCVPFLSTLIFMLSYFISIAFNQIINLTILDKFKIISKNIIEFVARKVYYYNFIK